MIGRFAHAQGEFEEQEEMIQVLLFCFFWHLMQLIGKGPESTSDKKTETLKSNPICIESHDIGDKIKDTLDS